jgi:hypothetical protein
MFALHETTRRIVCRTAFIALCVAPTLAVGAWIGERHWPGRKGRIAQELGQRAGVHVKLDDWRTPRPGLVRSSGMVVSDPRTALALADVAGVEVRTSSSTRLFSIERATIECEELKLIATRVYAWLTNLPAQDQEVRIGALELKAGAARFSLNNVQGHVQRDSSGRLQAQLSGFSVGGKSTDPPAVRLTLAPSSEKGNASPQVTLEVSTAMPGRALAAVAPGFGSFGKSATFVGSVRWTLGPSAMRGAMSGRVEQVDLAGLRPEGSPHELRGLATVALDELRWSGERIERLAGSMTGGRAQVSKSLVEAMDKIMRCPRPAEGLASAVDPTIIELDAIGVRFQLDDHGLTLEGKCKTATGTSGGCLLVSGGRPLVMQPPFQGIPVGALVQALSAPPSAWVPATREAVEMAERLPLPNSTVVR